MTAREQSRGGDENCVVVKMTRKANWAPRYVNVRLSARVAPCLDFVPSGTPSAPGNKQVMMIRRSVSR